MKPPDIFGLIVRLAGFFTVLFAAYVLLTMFAGVGLSFTGLVSVLLYAVLGTAVMKAAPALVEFAYPGSAAKER